MSQNTKPEFTILVPVYNSTKSVEELVAGVASVFARDIKESFEILLIDDGSANPQTWSVLAALAKQYSFVKAIRLSNNFGKQAAMMCGFSYAMGKYIITMDDDLQHLPEDLPKLIAQKDHEAVIANFEKQQSGPLKAFMSWANNKAECYLLHKPAHITNSAFKLLNRRVVDSFLEFKTSNPSISSMLFYITTDIVNVPATHGKRVYGKSGFSFTKMLRTFTNMLFNNSSVLLRFISYVGTCLAVCSFLFGVYILIKKLTIGIPVPGYTSLLTMLSFIGGLIVFSIGVLGEYLVRIINGVEQKPAYFVRETISETEKWEKQ